LTPQVMQKLIFEAWLTEPWIADFRSHMNETAELTQIATYG